MKLGKLKATTAESIEAKARIVPLILDDEMGSLQEAAEMFFRTFAADVLAFTAPIVEAAWRAKNLSDRSAAPGRIGAPHETNPPRRRAGRPVSGRL